MRIAPLLVGALAGVFWVMNYSLGSLDAGAVILAHLAAGAGLALILPPWRNASLHERRQQQRRSPASCSCSHSLCS